NDDFVARADGRGQRIVDRMFRAAGHDDLAGIDRELVQAVVPIDDRRPQFGNTGDGGVMRVAGANRVGSGPCDVLRRRLVRLTEAEVVHRGAGRLQLAGLGAGGQRRRRHHRSSQRGDLQDIGFGAHGSFQTRLRLRVFRAKRYHSGLPPPGRGNPRGSAMRLAQFVQRYPPALGGSEAYIQRLSRFLVDGGDSVTVWTTTAFDLEAFWSPRGRTFPAGESADRGIEIRRFPL